jgi:HEAT repeats/HEAT repeat
METNTMKKQSLRFLPLAVALVATSAAPALAGKGSSPEAIRRAIESNSVDAISAELERAERLLCGACVTMVTPLVDHQDKRVRQVAAWWLARRGLRSDLFVQMAYRLAQPDSRLARNAADVLGGMRHLKAVEPLGAALHNPVFDVEARSAMALALGRIGEPAGAPALVAALSVKDAPLRSAALQALRELRGPLDPRPATALLGDPAEHVRGEAAYTVAVAIARTATAAGRTPDAGSRDQATAALIRRLVVDPSASVRRKAAWALGEIGASAALAGPALHGSAARDADLSVRTLARAAIGRLTP